MCPFSNWQFSNSPLIILVCDGGQNLRPNVDIIHHKFTEMMRDLRAKRDFASSFGPQNKTSPVYYSKLQ